MKKSPKTSKSLMSAEYVQRVRGTPRVVAVVTFVAVVAAVVAVVVVVLVVFVYSFWDHFGGSRGVDVETIWVPFQISRGSPGYSRETPFQRWRKGWVGRALFRPT